MTTTRTFTADVMTQGTPEHGFDAFRRGWETQVGEPYPAPDFTPGDTGEFLISARAVKAHDSVIADVRSESLIGTNHGVADHVLLHVVQRNEWCFTRGRDGELTVPAGHFMLQHSGPPTHEVARDAMARVLILPASAFGPLLRDRLITGPAASPEMRLLLAHVHLVRQSAHDLGPAAAEAARNALIELVKGVLRQRADTTEPGLALTLVQAAKDLADRRLTDPDLSPSTLARELHVSVRTLHRAFTTTDDTVAAYIRRGRLEHARRELLADRPGVAELAARWHFADSSHFIRAFKRQYGRTPAEAAREPGDGPQPR